MTFPFAPPAPFRPPSGAAPTVLRGLAQPNKLDIVGAAERGQQQGRADRSRDAIGQILNETFGGKLAALGKDNPDAFFKVAEAFKIPLNEPDRVKAFMGTIQAAAALGNGPGGAQAAAALIKQHRDTIRTLTPNVDTSNLDEQIAFLQSEPESGVEALNLLTDAWIEQGMLVDPATKGRKFSARTRILDDGSTIQTDTQGNRTVLDPAGNVVTGQASIDVIKKGIQEGIRIQTERAGGRAGATASEKRDSALIERGIAAAESTATIRRALTLMDTVKTGGIAAVSLAVKTRLGIEGADEGELSNSLGKAVLSQLRETFGAAFTESEGQRLERIEASFTKSPETNRRLLTQALRIAERTANRASKKAISKGLGDEAEDIRSLLDFTLDIEEEGATNVGRFQVEVIEG